MELNCVGRGCGGGKTGEVTCVWRVGLKGNVVEGNLGPFLETDGGSKLWVR